MSLSSLRAHSATCAPRFANSTAQARPIPCDAPVTSATWPFRSDISLHLELEAELYEVSSAEALKWNIQEAIWRSAPFPQVHAVWIMEREILFAHSTRFICPPHVVYCSKHSLVIRSTAGFVGGMGV